MNEIIKHLGNILAMDWATLGVIGALCAAASYALKEYLANPVFVIFVYPVLFVLSVLTQYAFVLGEIFVPRKMDQWLTWTIMASILGNIAGIALVAWLGRLRAALATAPNRR